MRTVRQLAPAAPLAALLLAGCAGQLDRSSALPAACGTPTGAPWLGCANRANLAAMAADPDDLKHGRAPTPASGLRAAQVVEAYEAPPPPHDPGADTKTETTR